MPHNKRQSPAKDSPNRGSTLKLIRYEQCGHDSRTHLNPIRCEDGEESNVWFNEDDSSQPLSIANSKLELLKVFYTPAYCRQVGNIVNFYTLMDELALRLKPSDEQRPPFVSLTRQYKNKKEFPWTTTTVPNKIELQFSSSTKFKELFVVPNKYDTMSNIRYFSAAVLDKFFPACCCFHFTLGSVTKGGKQPYAKVHGKCLVPICQLQITVVFPKTPSNSDQPYKFCLIVGGNRHQAFHMAGFMHEKGSPAFMCQKIKSRCPRCITNDNVEISNEGTAIDAKLLKKYQKQMNATIPTHLSKNTVKGFVNKLDIAHQVVQSYYTPSGNHCNSRVPPELINRTTVHLFRVLNLTHIDFDLYQKLVQQKETKKHELTGWTGSPSLVDYAEPNQLPETYSETVNIIEHLPTLKNRIQNILLKIDANTELQQQTEPPPNPKMLLRKRTKRSSSEATTNNSTPKSQVNQDIPQQIEPSPKSRKIVQRENLLKQLMQNTIQLREHQQPSPATRRDDNQLSPGPSKTSTSNSSSAPSTPENSINTTEHQQVSPSAVPVPSTHQHNIRSEFDVKYESNPSPAKMQHNSQKTGINTSPQPHALLHPSPLSVTADDLQILAADNDDWDENGDHDEYMIRKTKLKAKLKLSSRYQVQNGCAVAEAALTTFFLGPTQPVKFHDLPSCCKEWMTELWQLNLCQVFIPANKLPLDKHNPPPNATVHDLVWISGEELANHQHGQITTINAQEPTEPIVCPSINLETMVGVDIENLSEIRTNSSNTFRLKKEVQISLQAIKDQF